MNNKDLEERINKLEIIVKEQEENLIKLVEKLPVIIQQVFTRNKPVNRNKNNE
jgi:uncharacterized coiled-coil protein SlyX